jgi:heme-degrading monooxygenase HmoA
MHARVTHSKREPAKADESIRFVKDTVVPNAKKQPGFKGGYWLMDRTTGKGIGITLWESEETMRASDDASKQLADKATATGTQITGVERYEVVHQA